MGHRQAVRHRTLTPAVASSNLAGPADEKKEKLVKSRDLRAFLFYCRIVCVYGKTAREGIAGRVLGQRLSFQDIFLQKPELCDMLCLPENG